MTKKQFDAAVKMVREGVDVSGADDSMLDGCALPGFVPVTVTLEAAAKCIQWHALCFNGQFDGEALNEMRSISRKRWLIC